MSDADRVHLAVNDDSARTLTLWKAKQLIHLLKRAIDLSNILSELTLAFTLLLTAPRNYKDCDQNDGNDSQNHQIHCDPRSAALARRHLTGKSGRTLCGAGEGGVAAPGC